MTFGVEATQNNEPWQGRAAAWLRHLGCVVALMWVPLVNGQPFFFPDTTAYVRAGDLIATLVTRGHVRSAWGDRYEAATRAKPPASTRQKAAEPSAPAVTGGNDLRAGNIMAGRSPYIGFLLYLGYMIGNFWPFVLAQAACAYALIVLSLRRFGVARPRTVVAVVGALAASVSLPFYNGLLLADALAGFGVLSFLLLATDGRQLRRGERLFLALLLLLSVSAHMTHIVMLIAMMVLLLALQLAQVVSPIPKHAMLAGIGGIALGIFSVWLTGAVVRSVFDKPPQLAPLLTARFIADGPGADFVRAGCSGEAFVACRNLPASTNSDVYLWSGDPKLGGYLPLDPDMRARMAAEDQRFALAVLRAYPLREGAMMVRNTVLQLATFPLTGLNEGCFAQTDCWSALPGPVRARLRETPAGHNAWPVQALDVLLYGVVIASAAAIALLVPALHRQPLGRTLLLWVALTFVAMLACAFFGGALSQPQWRYQGRLIWLVPFLAAIAILLRQKCPRSQSAQ